MIKKRILIILTGGTISMRNHLISKKANIHDGYNDLLSELIDGLPEIEISYHVFSLLPSPSMTPEMMFTLGKLCIERSLNKDIDGIVITHGTDTMEETAFFLDSFLDIKIPVVITGSMRNLSELGFDGLSNLASAVLVAASNESRDRGVLVVMNDEINAASEVIKTHTVALDTFKSPEFGPLGIVDQKDVLYYRDTNSSYFDFLISKIVSEVEIIKVASGSNSNYLKLLVDSGVKGIVLESLGRGNVPPMMLDGISYALENDIPVILTSRCFKGRILDTYEYSGGGACLKKMGVIFAAHMTSQKARIRLILALSSSLPLKKTLSNAFDF